MGILWGYPQDILWVWDGYGDRNSVPTAALGFYCQIFSIDDLISAADKKLFRQISNETHCLHPLLSKQKLLKYLIISEIAATNICFGKLKHNTIQKQFPQQMFIFLYLVLYVFTVCCV